MDSLLFQRPFSNLINKSMESKASQGSRPTIDFRQRISELFDPKDQSSSREAWKTTFRGSAQDLFLQSLEQKKEDHSCRYFEDVLGQLEETAHELVVYQHRKLSESRLLTERLRKDVAAFL